MCVGITEMIVIDSRTQLSLLIWKSFYVKFTVKKYVIPSGGRSLESVVVLSRRSRIMFGGTSVLGTFSIPFNTK